MVNYLFSSMSSLANPGPLLSNRGGAKIRVSVNTSVRCCNNVVVVAVEIAERVESVMEVLSKEGVFNNPSGNGRLVSAPFGDRSK